MTTIPTRPAALDTPRPYPSGLARYTLAAFGVCCVGMGGVGVVVPGLPTTVFLIIASWCFARSCPWLTEKLIHNRFFGPFVKYIAPGAVMPRRAKIIAAAMMWTAIAASCWLLIAREVALWVPVTVAISGVVGTWFIARQGHKARRLAAENDRIRRHPVGRVERGHKNPACMTTTGTPSTTH